MNGRIRLKAVLLGDPGVSKTTMIHEFLKTGRSNAPNDLKIFHFSTCELEFSFNKKNCFGNTENPVLISVWDTCGKLSNLCLLLSALWLLIYKLAH